MSNLRSMGQILWEQVDTLRYLHFSIKKSKFLCATKKGNEIALHFKIWLGENSAKIKNTEMTIRFVDGISDSKASNDIFSRGK